MADVPPPVPPLVGLPNAIPENGEYKEDRCEDSGVGTSGRKQTDTASGASDVDDTALSVDSRDGNSTAFPHIPLSGVGRKMEWRPYKVQREAILTAHADELYKEDDESDDLGHGEGNILYGMWEQREIDFSKWITLRRWARAARSPLWTQGYLVLSVVLMYFCTFLNVLCIVQLKGIWCVMRACGVNAGV